MAGTSSNFDRMADNIPGLGRDPQACRRRIEAMERLLEGLFVIPGTNQRLGLDVILNVIPVGGTAIAAAMGGYMIWEARNLKVPKHVLVRMAANTGFDALLGVIPVIGAVPDFFFRSNTRNLRLLRKHLDRHHPGTAIIDG